MHGAQGEHAAHQERCVRILAGDPQAFIHHHVDQDGHKGGDDNHKARGIGGVRAARENFEKPDLREPYSPVKDGKEQQVLAACLTRLKPVTPAEQEPRNSISQCAPPLLTKEKQGKR